MKSQLENELKMKNKKLFYTICILFSIGSIFLLIVSEEVETILISLLTILFFGCGGIVVYILDKKENAKKTKTIALMFGCLIFVISSYSALPFNHLLDDVSRYTPVSGWIIGVVGILFFGFGFIVSIKKLIKNND